MQATSFLIFAIVTAATAAIIDGSFEHTQVIPITEIPGFWNGRIIQPMNGQFRNKFDREERIVGGDETRPNAHPYQAGLLIMIHWWTGLCGGSLISRNLVITAAHCVENTLGLTVVLGAHRLFNSLEETQLRIGVEPENVIMHPLYDPRMFYNDLALVVLTHSVIFNEFIQPIKLPDEEMMRKDFAGEIATVSGET